MRVARLLLPFLLLVMSLEVSVADDARVTAQFPRVITGRVTDAEGSPLAGALVEWGYYTAGPEDREWVETEADGSYRLETTHVDRDYRLGISHGGFAPWRWDRLIPGPAAAPTTVDVQLKPGSTVSVQVLDVQGNSVPGLNVTPGTPQHGSTYTTFRVPVFGTPLPGRNRTATTDADGTVTLSSLPTLPASGATERRPDRNWLSLRINAGDTRIDDTNVTEAAVLSGDPVVVRIPSFRLARLQPHDGVLLGQAIDKETRRPLRDCLVTLSQSSVPQEVHNADGRFVVGGELVRDRSYEIRVFAAGYAVGVARLSAESRETASVQMIEIERHPSLSCRLVDAGTGEPVTDGRVLSGTVRDGRRLHFEWGEFERYADARYSLENVLLIDSDDNGRFTISEPADARTLLFVLADGYVRRYLTPRMRPEPGADGILRIELQPAVSVTANVLRNTPFGEAADSVHIGRVIDNVQEYLESGRLNESYETVPVDDSGSVVFDSLGPGTYRLSLGSRIRGLSFPCYSKIVTISEGGDNEVLLGDMPGTLRLFGIADPFAVIFVDPTFPAEISSFAIQADVDGNYELRDLFPGEYDVRVDTSSSSSGNVFTRKPTTIQLTEDTELPLVTVRPTNGEAEANRRLLFDSIQNQ